MSSASFKPVDKNEAKHSSPMSLSLYPFPNPKPTIAPKHEIVSFSNTDGILSLMVLPMKVITHPWPLFDFGPIAFSGFSSVLIKTMGLKLDSSRLFTFESMITHSLIII